MNDMRAWFAYFAAGAGLFALALLFLVILSGCAPAPAAQFVSSTVKVILESGHGSGVHIGGGYVLTAGHVVGDVKTVKLQFDDKSIVQADVMWSNKAKDVALLRYKDNGRAESSNLVCRVAAPGEHVVARGNPLGMEYLSFEGRINGLPMSVADFEGVLPADLTLISGMSGGGVFDDGGNVIGISVAHALAPIGMIASWTRVALVVPGKTVCDLMGKGV